MYTENQRLAAVKAYRTAAAGLRATTRAHDLDLLNSPERVDLMINGVGLPDGMNGRQLAEAARLRRPGLKILFITGYAENAVFSDGHLESGMAMVSKPLDLDELARRSKALIDAVT